MARVATLGTVFKTDDDDSGSTYTTITLLLGFKRPSRTREMIEYTALEDTLHTERPGIEIAGQVTILLFSDPGSTQDALFTTLFANKTEYLNQFLYPDSGTETFEAVVVGYEPQETARNEYMKALITLNRLGASTFA